MKKLIVSFTAALTLALTGCASSPNSAMKYEADQAGELIAAQKAQVLAIREVTVKGKSGMVSGTSGGLVGGAIGSMMGKGSGSTVGALLGTITGAVIGTGIEAMTNTEKAIELTLVQGEDTKVIVQPMDKDVVFSKGMTVLLLKQGKTFKAVPAQHLN